MKRRPDQDPKFYKADGSPTMYAYACGYLMEERIEDVRVKLWRDSACWQVQVFGFRGGHVRIAWESFDGGDYALARKTYRAFIAYEKARLKLKDFTSYVK